MLLPLLLNDFVHDRREFRRREGAQRLRANEAELPDTHRQRDHGGLVRRVDDRDDVVLPLCPVVLLDPATKFCGEFLIMARSIGGILDVKDTFIREIDQRDVGCHSVSFRFEALAPLRSPTARRRSRHFLILRLFQAQASCALIDINSRSSFLTVSGEEPPATWPIADTISDVLRISARACPHLSQASAHTSCNPAEKLRAVFS